MLIILQMGSMKSAREMISQFDNKSDSENEQTQPLNSLRSRGYFQVSRESISKISIFTAENAREWLQEFL